MGNIGLKLSQLGYNVKNADDKNLVFSSAWKLLKIIESGVVVPNSTTYTIDTHGLGYVPMTLCFSEADIDYTKQANTSRLFRTWTSDTNLELRSGAGGGSTARLRYYTFDLDLEENYDAPSVELAEASKESELIERDFGVKLTLPGFDVLTETDWRNFVIHSRTRSPMIHRVVHDSKAGGGGSFTVPHNLGYVPTFFVYAKLAGDTHYQFLQTATDTFASGDAENIYVFIPYECDYTIVILKDPLLLS